ncbi:hypothetical protein GCM10010515_04730 [Streptomyces fructofermentans]|uniref:Uncharacterized protein n=1 Tax=Streptomyces fructofermentans TaxID=152141 RepID=A0A918N6X9_9ACTN|nr:hypothetical protein GCM10010515_04730 [Streptomyces fructofermentans]
MTYDEYCPWGWDLALNGLDQYGELGLDLEGCQGSVTPLRRSVTRPTYAGTFHYTGDRTGALPAAAP